MSQTKPAYVHFPGNPMAGPPCQMTHANMYGFFVKGEKAKIQAFIDMTLGAMPGSTLELQAMNDYCMLTFTDIQKIATNNPQFADRGWFQETDVVIWVPVAKMAAGKIQHLYWYPAFICVNNILALINGREIYGFNKYLCSYQMPKAGQSPDFFSVTLDCLQPFSQNTAMAEHELLNVKQVSSGKVKPIHSFFELVKEALTLAHSLPGVLDYDLDAFKQLLGDLFHPQMDQILFKQFPDGHSDRAVYQAVLHSPTLIKKIHHGAIYTHEFKVTFNQVESFPLAQMLGLAVGEQQPLLPFNLCFDFEQEAAFPLVEAN